MALPFFQPSMVLQGGQWVPQANGGMTGAQRPTTPFNPQNPSPEWLNFINDGLMANNAEQGSGGQGSNNFYGGTSAPFYDKDTNTLILRLGQEDGFRVIPNASAYLNHDGRQGLNGLPDFRYDSNGQFKGQGTVDYFEQPGDGGLMAVASILALPFAAAALGVGAGAAGAGSAGAGAGAAGAAGAGAGAAGAAGAGAGAAAGAAPSITGLAGSGMVPAGMGFSTGAGALGAGATSFGTGALGLDAALGSFGAAAGAAGALGSAGGSSFLNSLSNGASSLLNGASGSLPGWGSLIGPAASLIGGVMQSNAAGDAADAMSNAAMAGIGEQRRQFDTVRELLSPYVQAGNTSLGAYQDLSGANGPDKQRAAMAALEASPQFSSLSKAGENAILQNAAATGGLRGGNVQGALADRRTALLNGLQQQQLGNYLPIVQGGQASAAGVGTAAMQTGQNVANLMGQQGAAQAGGIVAGSNAITNTIGSLGGFFAGQNAANVAAPPVDLRQGMNFGSGVVPSFSNGGNLF